MAAQLLAAEAGVDTSPAWARVHVAEGLWLTLRAAPIGDAETGVGSGIAVSIEESSPAERVDLFARCFALTTREQELLGHLVKGNDTKQIARAMFLSEHRPGSPQVDLREDVHPHPQDAAVAGAWHDASIGPS